MKRAAPDPSDQQGGTLFRFNLARRDPPHTWRNAIYSDRFTATLEQTRAPTEGDDIGGEVRQALQESIARQMHATIGKGFHRYDRSGTTQLIFIVDTNNRLFGFEDFIDGKPS